MVTGIADGTEEAALDAAPSFDGATRGRHFILVNGVNEATSLGEHEGLKTVIGYSIDVK